MHSHADQDPDQPGTADEAAAVDREKRLTRNVSELLQELRVAQAGVQILFGFLLSITFTERYAQASDLQRTTHLVAVAFSVAAVVLLTAPAAWHRVLFRRGKRDVLLRLATRTTIVGLGCLSVAITVSVLLLTEVALRSTSVAVVVAVVTALVIALIWFAVPLRLREDER